MLLLIAGCGSDKEEPVSKPVEQKQTVQYNDQQRQTVTDWYKNIKADLNESDQKWQQWNTIMDGITNKSIPPEIAAQNLDSLYTEMDVMAKKIDQYEAPDGLPDELKKKLHQSIIQIEESIKSRRGACMTLRDALQNGILKESKIEIVQKKLKGSEDQKNKGMANITDVTNEMSIDITKL